MKEFIASEVLPNTTGALLILGTFRAFAFPRHMHEGYSIGLIHSGVNRFECAGSSWAARPGSLCVMNPEQIHSGEADCEGWTYTNLFLEQSALLGALGKEANASPIWFRQHVLDDPFAVARFKALAEASVPGAESMAAECEYTLLLARLGQIARGPSQEKKASARALLRVRDMLDSVCDRSIALAELARVGDMNTFHLVRSFTEEFGISPYAYHMNRRLQRAQRMIEAGTFVAEAAFATGFTDQAHFTRHFRRFLGITPGRVAKFVKRKR
ncbi:AraC family transcriptional regulator [Rugamonas sp. CCM 8940]|uniref:helix-turn-helix transcriptional regulator n=1 Tax=Rugamonas sp. CCM 8940 TaxID=2765359 RepID=UPI0018F6966A|nr:AraC family transcriptional regulator [Rugamonas sp. CCM 8940]MBJ7311261.1 AraC family transcriptional regulator [Rugamonas sp. CCM 8940]